MNKLLLNGILVFALFNFSAVFAETYPNDTKQFTFSWQFLEDDSMQPRGGTTKGKPSSLPHVVTKIGENKETQSETKSTKIS